ncbi:hypothetical protein D3C83_93800 [compost metagenome]
MRSFTSVRSPVVLAVQVRLVEPSSQLPPRCMHLFVDELHELVHSRTLPLMSLSPV